MQHCYTPCTEYHIRCICLQLKAVQLIKRAEVIVYDDLGTQVALITS